MTSREFRDEYNGLGEEVKAAAQLERNGLEVNGLGWNDEYCEACVAGMPCPEREAEETEEAERLREAAEAREACEAQRELV
jgi:thioesterase domain-containing protein